MAEEGDERVQTGCNGKFVLGMMMQSCSTICRR